MSRSLVMERFNPSRVAPAESLRDIECSQEGTETHPSDKSWLASGDGAHFYQSLPSKAFTQ